MSSEYKGQNPYESPRADAATDFAPLQPREHIAFSGIVRRTILRRALTGRFSWAGLGTLLVGALICFAASPPTFFRPFLTVGRLRVDFMGELLAVAGIGFVVLALWHLGDHCTAWGVRRREKYFLRRASGLFQTQVSGWLDRDYAYVKEGASESWLSWAALNHLQANEEVAFLEWGSGAGGITVLTSEMFDTHQAYR